MPSDNVDPRKLFIKNLDFQATTDDLWDHFEDNGFSPVDVFVPKDRNYQEWKNRGHAFAEFETEAEARGSIKALHDRPGPYGRALWLDVAKPDKRRWK